MLVVPEALTPALPLSSTQTSSQVLVLLDTKRTGYVDLGLLLMCLVAVWYVRRMETLLPACFCAS